MQFNSVFLELLMPSIQRHSDYGQFILLAVSLLLFITYISIKNFFPKYYNHLFFIAFKQDIARVAYSETNSNVKQADLVIIIAAAISIGGAIYTVFRYYPYNTIILSDSKTILEFSVITLGVIILMMLKYLTYHYFAWLFNIQLQIKAYLDSFFHALRLTGLIVFPVFILIPFVGGMLLNVLITLILVMASILFFYNLFIFFRQSLKIKFFNHYSILYFCIFEILPIIVLIKLLGKF